MAFIGYNPKVLNCYSKLDDPIIDIPTTDDAAWTYFPNERWIYNKLDIAISQNIRCGPVGVEPPIFPVVLKPIYNMFGGGIEARKIESRYSFNKHLHPGCMWMQWLEGPHHSHDIMVLNGEPVWHISFKGHPLGKGMFDYWEVVKCTEKIILYVLDWIKKYLPSFTGCVCLETIGTRIIEAHLRMGDVDRLGNYNLMSNIISLYQDKVWNFKEEILEFYLFAIWGQSGIQYNISPDIVTEICSNLTSYQIDNPDLYYQNPIGGIRLAILNDDSKYKCVEARNRLISEFRPVVPQYLREKLIS